MRPRVVALALAAAIVLAAATPAGAQEADAEGRVVGIERRTAELVRRVESISGDVRQSETTDEIVVDLAADVLFAFDSDQLAPEARATLAGVAASITEEGEGPVSVVGHTDDVGEDAYNQDLSERRAASVVTALEGLAPDVAYESEGRGETEPVADNGTPDGQARNRRVTVTFAKTE